MSSSELKFFIDTFILGHLVFLYCQRELLDRCICHRGKKLAGSFSITEETIKSENELSSLS